jgi:type IV secretory pathway TraG/TraD family ATPase VirD4
MQEKMILGEGKEAVYSTDCNVTGLNNNVIVCAGAGGGKTMSIIEPKLLETYDSSVVVTVTKRRIVEKYKEMFRNRGYHILDMNFAQQNKSDLFFDPLSYVNSYSDITHLAHSIVMANPRKSNDINTDPYWDDSAQNLLESLIAMTMMTHKGKVTFNDVYETATTLTIKEMDGGIITSLDDIFGMIIGKMPTCFAAAKWMTFKNSTMRTASCILGIMQSAVNSLFSEEIMNQLKKSGSVDIEDIAKRKTALFITTSPVNKASNMYVNMFYSQLFKTLFEYAESQPTGKLPIPVSVLCDDFATGSKITSFPEYISIFREKQISVMLLLQSESQLARMYGEYDATTIINNCDTYVYLGGMDIKTGENVSRRLNRPLEDVLNMPLGKEIIFRRGHSPLFTDRYDILNDPKYQEVTEEYEKRLDKDIDMTKTNKNTNEDCIDLDELLTSDDLPF